MAEAVASGERLRLDVQGLRALAVVAVIGFHYHLAPFTNGYVGVDVFFVISGFVITQALWREREATQRTSLTQFYARRIRRIVPAATVTLIVTVIGSWILVGAASAMTSAHDAIAALLFYANVHFAQQATSYLSQGAPQPALVHYWSLSIEEQFYVVWPGLFAGVAILARTGRRTVTTVVLVVICALALVESVIATHANQNAAYYSTFIRAGELALGAVVATVAPRLASVPTEVRRVVGWVGFGVVIAAVTGWGNANDFPGWWVVVGPLATAAIIASGPGVGRVSAHRVLGWRPFVAVGTISYSLYLWHWPVYDLVALRLGHDPSLLTRLGLVVVAAVLATVSYRFIESPIRHSAVLRTHPGRTLAMGGVFGGATTATIVATVMITSSTVLAAPAPLSLNALGRQLAAASTARSTGTLVVPLTAMSSDVAYAGFDRGCLIPYNSPTPMGAFPTGCDFGDTRARRTVVLMGDSNADMWLPALSALGDTEGFKVVLVARASCQLEDLKMWDPVLHAPGVTCTAFRRDAIRLVRRLHPAVVVLADYEYGIRWDYHDHPYTATAVSAGLTRTVRALATAHTRVVMLGVPPAQFTDPVTCLSSHSNDPTACATPVECVSPRAATSPQCRFDPSTGRTWAYLDGLPTAVRDAGGTFVPVTTLFCSSTSCPAVVDHEVVYFDLRHVALHYTELVAPALGELIAQRGVTL